MPETRRLFVHVGLQKTGTSYLQGVMLKNREALAAQGLDLVPPTKRDSFHLMLMVRDRYSPGRDPASVTGALDRFADQLAAAPGSRALLSQESLAAARPGQVERLLAACGDREVHVVLTVRDLARQLPSAWQQELKAGGATPYGRYLAQLRRHEAAGSGGHPWIHLDPPQVLARWATPLGPDRVHVVTVPPSGSSPTLLLERFCRVLEVDPSGLAPDEGPGNTSLGRVQAEVLQRVNAELPEELRRRNTYGDVGKRFFAVPVLGSQERRPIRVPARFRSWCEEVTERQVAAIVEAGYPVEGSLEELRCPPSAFATEERPPTQGEVAQACVEALASILRGRMEAGAPTPAPATPPPGRLRRSVRRVVRRARARRAA